MPILFTLASTEMKQRADVAAESRVDAIRRVLCLFGTHVLHVKVPLRRQHAGDLVLDRVRS